MRRAFNPHRPRQHLRMSCRLCLRRNSCAALSVGVPTSDAMLAASLASASDVETIVVCDTRQKLAALACPITFDFNAYIELLVRTWANSEP